MDDLAIKRAGGGTQVSKLKKELGEDTTSMLLASLIFDLADFYNVKHNISDQQAGLIVELLMTQFWHLKIEQIARAFYLQKIGSGVKVFERIDPSVIITILTNYEEQFAWVHEQDSLRFKERYDYNRASSLEKEKDAMRIANLQYLREKKPDNQ